MLSPFESDFARQRKEMVESQLARRGIRDSRVLHVLALVPRERFLPPQLANRAYEDRALPIAFGQTISQPYIVAFMTEALAIAPNHRVLEIGTGSGYQTAVLARLASQVYSVERLDGLTIEARDRFAELGIENVMLTTGDGTLGWPEHAPYDRIIVTAASPDVPKSLLDQLADGGRMIIPVGDENVQRLIILERQKGRLVERPSIDVRFVKLVGEGGFAN